MARPSVVAAIYLAISLAMTWPLVTVMTRQIAGILGDPLFNCWVLLWTGGQVLRFLQGDVSALAHYWNANIFYPAPLTLAYSEHLTPLMLQILPVLAVTHNIILCYNLLLLGTFVLSGLGMYLLVRELTGAPAAAFLAGLAFAFAPYRVDQFEHLEVLSSQWMPFALYGFRRFFATDRWRPLIGGAVALLAQALSCGYYLAYFPPFVVAYCLYEMVTRGTIRDLVTWRRLIIAGSAVLFVVALFLRPYFQVRAGRDVGVRDPREIALYSADTHAFATISSYSRLWGNVIRAMPRNEGQGFPGVTILAFAAVAVAAGLRRAVDHARRAAPAERGWRRGLTVALVALLAGLLTLLAQILVSGHTSSWVAHALTLRRDAATRLLGPIAMVFAALLIVARRWRAGVRGVPGSTLAFFACAAIAAAWMSLGPVMRASGVNIGPGLYNVFYRWIPGFDGLRVVSLNFMLVALFLAVLAGLGAAALLARPSAVRRAVVAVGTVAILAECWGPTPVNLGLTAPGYARPPQNIADVPYVYRVIRNLPDGTVVVEFPLGTVAHDIRYVFFSGYHRKAIINGYSGFSPASFERLRPALTGMPSSASAWHALLSSGATHAIVHERAFLDNDGLEVSAWLRRFGAREIAAANGDRVFQLR